ncbi:hypothetical protein HYT01_01920 [Candidatus Giovannonibacteria bacterium]|nr:hypothetical protein [Candidatus Giovannonibacteria bacterium]
MENKNEKNIEDLQIKDPVEAANTLIEQYNDLQTYTKEKWAEPPSDKYHSDENQAMAEDDGAKLEIERVEDLFTDLWQEDIASEIKEATLRKLLDIGREDVVRQIAKFNDISDFVDQATLEKVRGAK